MSEVERGQFMGHVACPIHGGSDSLALYDKGDKIDGYCWSQCGGFSTKRLIDLEILDESGKKVIVDFATNGSKGVFVMTDEIMKEVNDVLDKPILGWRERNIPKLVSEFYDVRTVSEDGKVKYRYYPSTIDGGKLVGWHVRNDFVKQARNRGEKPAQAPFFPVGKVRSDCELFGQSKFNKGGKYLVLASGEEDAQAIFTALNVERSGSGLELKKFITPVISTTVGEGAVAQIKENYDFITSFENVIIMYDNDDAGREGAEKVARLLKSGQAKIAKYHRKDACAHSKEGEFDAIVNAFWKAEQYSPVGILKLTDMWDDFEKDDLNVKIPFAPSFSKLNEMMNGGLEFGEVTIIGALTSIGKSSIINNNVYHWLETLPYKIGAMYLEGTKREVVRDMLSLEMSMNLRKIDRSSLDMSMLKTRFMNFAQKDNFVFVDHQGSIGNKDIFDKFNYLAKSEGCKIIILDVLQAAVNSSDNSAIIDFMDTILKFAKETDTCIIVVSHMRKPDGDDPHNVSEYDLMGSSSINQIAFNTILLSRDKMSDSKLVKNSTHLKLVKCRRTGETGDAGWVRYDPETTHLYASFNPYDLDEASMDEEEMFGNVITQDDIKTETVTQTVNEPKGDASVTDDWEVNENASD